MKKIIALVATVVLLTTVGIIAVGKKLPSVGYVLVGPANDGGWSMRHFQGFKSLEKHGYNVEGVESVSEADSERVFKKLARKHIPHSIILSIGDQPGDIGEYGGVGVLLSRRNV